MVSTPRHCRYILDPNSLKRNYPIEKAEAEKKASGLAESQRISFIARSGNVRTENLDTFCPAARYAPATKILYMSHLHGIHLMQPTTGCLLCQLTTKQDSGGGMAPVDMSDKAIYALSGKGTVYALRHPKV